MQNNYNFLFFINQYCFIVCFFLLNLDKKN